MRRISKTLSALFLLLPLLSGAAELPCDTSANPTICSFLNRYISELQQWKRKDVSIRQKMHDDKFLIIDGSLDNLGQCNDTTVCNIQRLEDKAYEVEWRNGEQVLLHVAFPVQYELILGMSKNEIERYLPDYIAAATEKDNTGLFEYEETGNGIYRSTPHQHYQLEQLNNCVYFRMEDDQNGQDNRLQLIDDTTYAEYTLANLFQRGLEREYELEVSQSIYGGENLTYTVPLQQWIRYCKNAELTCYVAVEEQTTAAWKVMVVAESKDLSYNHLLSVLVPRQVLSRQTGTLPVRLNAFIPTHNIKNLYKEEQK